MESVGGLELSLFSLDTQLVAMVSTIAILILSAILAYFMSTKYAASRSLSTAFWSTGLWLFTLGVFEEVLFAYGIYNSILIKTYLAIVAVLVQFLAMGSLSLGSTKRLQLAYWIYSIVVFVFLFYSLVVSSIGNIISSFVVFGPLPLLVIVGSSIITFPAAIILLVTAILTYRKTKSRKMLSIILGVIIVSVAGTLYIAKFPAFLYFAEFVGILLLWAGFFEWNPRKRIRNSEA